MLSFFNTKERLRFLFFVMAIAIPILIVASWVVSTMESSSAAKGEPNGKGGLHYRVQDDDGTHDVPPPLAALMALPPTLQVTDAAVDTDGNGKVVSAVVKGYTHDNFTAIAAFHKPQLAPVTTDSATELWGNRNGYEVKIMQDNSPHGDAHGGIKVEYYINPAKS
jgi:hypothetical protein